MAATADGVDFTTLRQLSRSERVQQLFGFEPLDYQAAVLDDPAQRVLWVCGRQVGKTETASVIPADFALTHAGEDVMVAARFQETADELFRRTKQHIENIPLSPAEIGLTKQNETTYEFDNGSRILSRTLSNDAAQQRGKLPRCIVVEEGALVATDVYEKVIRPMFLTHDDYELYIVTTPMGKSGYVWDKWNAPGERWSTHHIASPDSPLTNDDELATIESGTDDLTWRQEYLGQFVEEGDSYLPHSLVEPCVSADRLIDNSQPRYLGVDIARKGADRTVYYDLDANGDTRDVWAEETSTGPGVVGRIRNLHDEHGYDEILIDENAVGGFAADFSKEGLGGVVREVTFSSKSKQEMYQALKRAFEDSQLTIPDGHQYTDRIVHELTSLTFDFTAHGKLRVHAPPGGHDDFPDALALANLGREDAARTRQSSTWYSP